MIEANHMSRSVSVCPICGREFVAQDMKWPGYTTAHHSTQRTNLNRVRANRHANACQRKRDES